MYQFIIKRLLDILIALILLPILIIVFIPVFLLIKFEDRGPVFYTGIRIGKNMKQFHMYKFRTMKVNAPDIRNGDGTTYNSQDDPRVTKVGKWLRVTSLDEIPQIINVLIGQMSFIGPRPSPLGDKSNYPDDFFKKFEVLPGITGYNQALHRNSSTMDQRIANDKYYVENISFILDAEIVILTIRSVLGRKNIHRN
ncbi:sugar transferase [Bacillus sp. FSL W7-1321]